MSSVFHPAFKDCFPCVMGILNVTPDSFSDGGHYTTVKTAVKHALHMFEQGACIVDIGGESTRPGADFVEEEVELNRILPIVKAIRAETSAPLSIDTRRPFIARAAIEHGVNIWNDVTALTSTPDAPEIAAQLKVPVILMHAQGSPKTMQKKPFYANPVEEIYTYLQERVTKAHKAGVEHVMIDPGLGFGKRPEDNLALLKNLKRFKKLAPVLIGASRKSMIGAIDSSASMAEDRLGGSLAAALWALEEGASCLRVHDVRETIQAIKIWQAIKEGP